MAKHLYRYGARGAQLRSFERRYGKAKGRRVYGATIGKVHRERYGTYHHKGGP